MKKALLAAMLMIIGIAAPCFSQPLASTELIDNAAQYDGKVVVFEGEAIGDLMKRGSFAWLNLHDGKNAIGIWASYALVSGISFTGSYGSRGDAVEITGVFHRACAEHGGDLDIHAQALRKISPGRRVEEKINQDKKNLAAILLGVLGVVWILTIFKRK